MTTKKKAIAGKREIKKLKLKRETLRDLDVKGRGIKGGVPHGCAGTGRVSGCSW